jgi:hypothetical protein
MPDLLLRGIPTAAKFFHNKTTGASLFCLSFLSFLSFLPFVEWPGHPAHKPPQATLLCART